MPPIVPSLFVVGAATLAGFAVYKVMEGVQADKQRVADFRAANGWSLVEIAQELTAGYDTDRDGRIPYDAVKGVRTLGESTRTTTRTYTRSAPLWNAPVGTLLVKESRATYSIEPLLRRADTDHDGVVTTAELHAALRAYDADGDGRVTAAERTRALAELGEVRVSTDTRTVGVIPPKPQPAPALLSPQPPAQPNPPRKVPPLPPVPEQPNPPGPASDAPKSSHHAR